MTASPATPAGAPGRVRQSMNRRLATVVAAATVVAGAGAALLPQHAVSVVRVSAVAVAVITGGLVLAAVAPYVTSPALETPLDRTSRRRVDALDPHGLRDARRDLSRPPRSGGLPSDVRERLRGVAELRLARVGLDLDTVLAEGALTLPAPVRDALAVSSPASPSRTADPARTAAVVHRVLDELDTIAHTTGGAHHGHR